MPTLKERLYDKIQAHRPRTTKILKEYGDSVIDKVTAKQVIGGMRGIKCLITDISYLDPMEGIRYRGHTLPDVFDKLPKPEGKEMPYVEGLYYLLLTGDIPSENEVVDLMFFCRVTASAFVAITFFQDKFINEVFNHQYQTNNP